MRLDALKLVAATVVMALAASFATDVGAQNLEQTADEWMGRVAESGAEEVLRDLERSGSIRGNLRGALKGSIKSYLKRSIKSRVLPDEISPAMASILSHIRDKLRGPLPAGNPGEGNRICKIAAKDLAWGIVADNRAVVNAAAIVFAEAFGLAAGGGASIVRNIGGKIASEIRQSVEQAIDDYLKDYGVETFGKAGSKAGCDYIIRIVWEKKRGQFRYLVAGDCHCQRVHLAGRRGRLYLSRWSVTGTGTAIWVGEEEERARATPVNPRSALLGNPIVFNPLVRAICCREGREPRISPEDDPWRFEEFDQDPTSEPDQSDRTEPSSEEESQEDADRGPRIIRDYSEAEFEQQRSVPQVPTGPVCPEERDTLVTMALQSLSGARARVELAQREVEDLEFAKADGETVSEEQEQNLRARLEAAGRHLDDVKSALEAIERLEVREDCPHSSEKAGTTPRKSGQAGQRQPNPSTVQKTEKSRVSITAAAPNWNGTWLLPHVSHKLHLTHAGGALTGYFEEIGGSRTIRWSAKGTAKGSRTASLTISRKVADRTLKHEYDLQLSPSSNYIFGNRPNQRTANTRSGLHWGPLYYREGTAWPRSPEEGPLLVHVKQWTGKPAAGFVVELSHPTREFTAILKPDERGFAEIVGLPLGEYTIRAKETDDARSKFQTYLPKLYHTALAPAYLKAFPCIKYELPLVMKKHLNIGNTGPKAKGKAP